MYLELDGTNRWNMNKQYFNDGYGLHHNNLYSLDNFSLLFKGVNDMFGSDKSKYFVLDLIGMDCLVDCIGAPSYYKTDHHYQSHTNHIGQRLVAYICYSHFFPWWHLLDPKGLINSIVVLGLIGTLDSGGEHHLLYQGTAAYGGWGRL